MKGAGGLVGGRTGRRWGGRTATLPAALSPEAARQKGESGRSNRVERKSWVVFRLCFFIFYFLFFPQFILGLG